MMFGSAKDCNLFRLTELEANCDYYRKENARLQNELVKTHKLLKMTERELALYTALEFDHETAELVVFKKKRKGEIL